MVTGGLAGGESDELQAEAETKTAAVTTAPISKEVRIGCQESRIVNFNPRLSKPLPVRCWILARSETGQQMAQLGPLAASAVPGPTPTGGAPRGLVGPGRHGAELRGGEGTA